jgi:hypothetical protein
MAVLELLHQALLIVVGPWAENALVISSLVIWAWFFAFPSDSRWRLAVVLLFTVGVVPAVWDRPGEDHWLVLMPVAFAVYYGYALTTQTRVGMLVGAFGGAFGILSAVANPNVTNLFRH